MLCFFTRKVTSSTNMQTPLKISLSIEADGKLSAKIGDGLGSIASVLVERPPL